MPVDAQITVRHPYVGEVPAELIRGYEICRIDPELQWVAVVEGRVVAMLLACDAHGILFILRLIALPEAPYGWALKLLRQVMEDARAMGMLGYLTMLSDSSKQERQLMRIVQRHGGYLEPTSGAIAAGRLEGSYQCQHQL